MTNLKRAHEELFRRTPDETVPSLPALWEHCQAEKERSTDRWRPPQLLGRSRTASGSGSPSATRTSRSGSTTGRLRSSAAWPG